MSAKRLAGVALVVVAALTVTIVRDHQELHALRRSHDTRVQFCQMYRALVESDQNLFSFPETRSTAQFLYGAYSRQEFLDLCRINVMQLQPERARAHDCDTIYRPDYTCLERAAAKLEHAIPVDIDP